MIKSEIFTSIKRLFASYKKNIIIISVVIIITSVGSFVSPWLTKQLIDLGIIRGDYSQTALYVGLSSLSFWHNNWLD